MGSTCRSRLHNESPDCPVTEIRQHASVSNVSFFRNSLTSVADGICKLHRLMRLNAGRRRRWCSLGRTQGSRCRDKWRDSRGARYYSRSAVAHSDKSCAKSRSETGYAPRQHYHLLDAHAYLFVFLYLLASTVSLRYKEKTTTLNGMIRY